MVQIASMFISQGLLLSKLGRLSAELVVNSASTGWQKKEWIDGKCEEEKIDELVSSHPCWTTMA